MRTSQLSHILCAQGVMVAGTWCHDGLSLESAVDARRRGAVTEVDKRAFVAALYPGPGWKKKVAQMSDSQVTAIYLREQAKPPKDDKPTKGENDDIPF